MPDNNAIFKPHRGTSSVMSDDSKKDLVLANGELFVEVPDTITNNNQYRFKVGDGVTTYENLPYAISGTNRVFNSIEEWEELSDEEKALYDTVDIKENLDRPTRTYRASGSIYFADLPALIESRVGNVYIIKDSFTTTASFKEGAGVSYPAGTNVSIIADIEDNSVVYYYDTITSSDFVDLSNYIDNNDYATTTNAGIVKPDGTTITVDNDGTIHGASTVDLSNYIDNNDYATTTNAGIVKPDGTTITVDNDGTIHGASNNYNGTLEAWNQLSLSEKAKYETCDFPNEMNGLSIDATPTTNSQNPVSSGGVKTALDAKAPTDHASTETTYGVGTTTNYGHNKIIDDLTKTSITNGESLSAHMGNTLGNMFAYVNTNSTTASKAYTQGEQFVLDGILRKATTAIAQDATLTLNTNYENAPSVTSQISNLSTNTAYSETTNKNDFDLASGVTVVSGGVTARKHGKCVWIYLIVQKTLTLNTWHNLFTVPSGYYPPGETIMFSAINDTTSLAISARLSNGVVSVYPVSGNSSAAAQNIAINISIILKS